MNMNTATMKLLDQYGFYSHDKFFFPWRHLTKIWPITIQQFCLRRDKATYEGFEKTDTVASIGTVVNAVS
jgi:hypothetical protein